MTIIQARRPFSRGTPPPEPAPKGALTGFLDRMFTLIEQAQLPQAVKLVDDDYVVRTSDQTITVDATAGPVSILFTDPSRVAYGVWTVKKIDASAHAVTLVATVDGVVDPTLATQWKSMTVQSDGTQYLKIAAV